MEKKITVLLVDDHGLVRRGFRRMLEDETDMEVVGEAGDGEESIKLVKKLHPQVVDGLRFARDERVAGDTQDH